MRGAAAACALAALMAAACGGPGVGRAVPGEPIRFTTDDGVEIVGELRGEGDVGVVLAHMFPADRTSWAAFSTFLADRGYRTLSFDFRGYGDSGGERDVPEIWRDVTAAVRALREEGATRVVVIGASMGGTAALVSAARQPIEGLITLSAPSTFMGLSAPPEALAANTEPKLFLAADGDAAAAETAQAFYEATPLPKRVEIVPGSDHGTELLEGSRAEVIRGLILDFLGRLDGAS